MGWHALTCHALACWHAFLMHQRTNTHDELSPSRRRFWQGQYEFNINKRQHIYTHWHLIWSLAPCAAVPERQNMSFQDQLPPNASMPHHHDLAHSDDVDEPRNQQRDSSTPGFLGPKRKRINMDQWGFSDAGALSNIGQVYQCIICNSALKSGAPLPSDPWMTPPTLAEHRAGLTWPSRVNAFSQSTCLICNKAHLLALSATVILMKTWMLGIEIKVHNIAQPSAKHVAPFVLSTFGALMNRSCTSNGGARQTLVSLLAVTCAFVVGPFAYSPELAALCHSLWSLRKKWQCTLEKHESNQQMNVNQASAGDKTVKKRVESALFELRVTENISGSHANFAERMRSHMELRTPTYRKSPTNDVCLKQGVLIIADHCGRKLHHSKTVSMLRCVSPHSLVGNHCKRDL